MKKDGHEDTFGGPRGGWPAFGPDGKVIRDEDSTPRAGDGKVYQLITLEGEPLNYWGIKEPAYGNLIDDAGELCIRLTTEDDFWYPHITDLKDAGR